MNLFDRFLAQCDRLMEWIWVLRTPAKLRRRARGTCPVCGKSLAIVASTGTLWRHRCQELQKPEVG